MVLTIFNVKTHRIFFQSPISRSFRMKAFLLAVIFTMMACMDAANALPRFSSRTGAKCQSCHVNPSGGGMRQTYGVQYGRDELPVPTWMEEYSIDDFSTQITEMLSVGADFRTLFFYQQLPDTGSNTVSSQNAFWEMQGDIYLNFKLAKKVNIYLDKGLYGGFEIFGTAAILPANGFVKIGKFVPNYGMKMDDHTIFARQATGFSSERGRAELTGGEVAISPGAVTVTGGIYNATDGFGAGTGSKKALLGRAEGIFKAADEIYVGIGGNVFNTKDAGNVQTTLYGGFGSFSYQNLTLLGEVDVIDVDNAGTKQKGFVSYLEANYVVIPGLDLKFAYDFYDKDVDVQSGAVSRYSFGFEFFPIAGVEVRPMYRIMKEDPTEVSNDELHFLIHFYL